MCKSPILFSTKINRFVQAEMSTIMKTSYVNEALLLLRNFSAFTENAKGLILSSLKLV